MSEGVLDRVARLRQELRDALQAADRQMQSAVKVLDRWQRTKLCGVCGEKLAPRKGRGRPRATCGPVCARILKNYQLRLGRKR